MLTASVALAFSAGCGDLSKYWDRSPTAPLLARDSTPPRVRLLSPSGPDCARATPVTGAAYAIAIEASDEAGVSRVLLHVDDLPAIEVAGPDWKAAWNTTVLEEGSCHALRVSAVDAAGNLATSETVYARVFNAGPEVSLSEPAAGALVRGSVRVTAVIAGERPDVGTVEFLSGAVGLGVLATPPWTIDLDTRPLAPGDHFLVARVTTTGGAVGVSPPVRVRVNNGAPRVAIAFPPAGHRVATRGTLILSGTALDGVEGAIPAERFSWRSSLDGALGTGPYLRVRALGVGTHEITASAMNAWGTESAAAVAVEVLARPTYTYCANIWGEILRPRCLACHVPGARDYPASLLDLRSYAGLRAGGISGGFESVAPCRPESSLIWNKLTAEIPWVGAPMPPRETYPALTPALLEKLRIWILEGAAPDEPEACPF